MEDTNKVPEDIQEAGEVYAGIQVWINEKQPLQEQEQEFYEYIAITAYIKGRMDERAKQQVPTDTVEQLAEKYVLQEFKKLQEIRVKEGDNPLPDNSVILKVIRSNKKPAFIAGYLQRDSEIKNSKL